MRVDLFVIDGQNDFCASGKEPLDWPWPFGGRRTGALFVEGADQEAILVADMIKRLKDRRVPGRHKVSKVHASLDSHPRNDCSHCTSYVDQAGNTAPPFTLVSPDDAKSSRWRPIFPFWIWEGQPINSQQGLINYTETLARDGRAPLCLWPVHCKIGSWGGQIYHPLDEAYDDWCAATGGWIDFITKGFWPWTEHYSALRADVPDPKIPATQMNAAVVQDANEADLIGWCGWAGSHCTRWTALDAVNYFGQGENAFLKKSVFFEDACAPVPNPPGGPDFAQWRLDFLDEVRNRGARVMKTTEFLVA